MGEGGFFWNPPSLAILIVRNQMGELGFDRP